MGIFDDPSPNRVLYFNWDYLNDGLPANSDFCSMSQQFHIKARSKEEVPRIAQAIDAALENSPCPTEKESEQIDRCIGLQLRPARSGCFQPPCRWFSHKASPGCEPALEQTPAYPIQDQAALHAL